MNYDEAKQLSRTGTTVYYARYDGRIWNAGRMVDVGDVIGYYATEREAHNACKDYELNDFDRNHLCTSFGVCGADEFAD